MRRRWVSRQVACDCGHVWFALLEDGQPYPPCPHCGAVGRRPDPIAPQSATVFSDTLWGGPQMVENFGPVPIRVETKSQYRALCAAHGMRQKVRHVPIPGTDKSPITQTWDIGLPPGVDGRPMALLSPKEQRVRRREAAQRLGCRVSDLAKWSRRTAALDRIPEPPRSACEFTKD